MTSEEFDWKNFFRGANADIYEIIYNAITVAYTENPERFYLKRGLISEKLFTVHLTECQCSCGYDPNICKESVDRLSKSQLNNNCGHMEGGGSGKNRFIDNSVDDTPISNDNNKAAEAQTDDIDMNNEIFKEVSRIRDTLKNSENQTHTALVESLTKLQNMDLPAEIMLETKIGFEVNALRKHRSREIQQMAQKLINDWKLIVDKWMESNATIAAARDSRALNSSGIGEEHCRRPSPPLDNYDLYTSRTQLELSQDPLPMKTSDIDEEYGLALPPMDDLYISNSPIQLSKFFEGLDEDGNPCNNTGMEMNHATLCEQKQKVETEVLPRNEPKKEKNNEKKGCGVGLAKGSNGNGGHCHKDDETDISEKLEAAKRKYNQDLERVAKKKRGTQFLDLDQLPKETHRRRGGASATSRLKNPRFRGHH